MDILTKIQDDQIPLIKAGITFNEQGSETIEEVLNIEFLKLAGRWAEAGRGRLVQQKQVELKDTIEANIPVFDKEAFEVKPAVVVEEAIVEQPIK